MTQLTGKIFISVSSAESVSITKEVGIAAIPINRILTGDAVESLASLPKESVDLSFGSSPYHMGKTYKKLLDFAGSENLLSGVILEHERVPRKRQRAQQTRRRSSVLARAQSVSKKDTKASALQGVVHNHV